MFTSYNIEEVSQLISLDAHKTCPTHYYIGPFRQVLSLRNLPTKGALQDEQLEVLAKAGLWIKNGVIQEIFLWNDLNQVIAKNSVTQATVIQLDQDYVLTPGLIDAHTHLCYAGTRAQDYADRLNGVSYQQITGINQDFQSVFVNSSNRVYAGHRNGFTYFDFDFSNGTYTSLTTVTTDFDVLSICGNDTSYYAMGADKIRKYTHVSSTGEYDLNASYSKIRVKNNLIIAVFLFHQIASKMTPP